MPKKEKEKEKEKKERKESLVLIKQLLCILFQALTYIFSFNPINITTKGILLSSSHSLEGKLMHREVKQTAQEHTAS